MYIVKMQCDLRSGKFDLDCTSLEYMETEQLLSIA